MSRNYKPTDVFINVEEFNAFIDKLSVKFNEIDELNLAEVKEIIDQLKSSLDGGSISDFATKNYVNKSLEDKVDKVDGSSLITSEQLEQITRNQNDIKVLQSQLEGVETVLNNLSSRLGEVV